MTTMRTLLFTTMLIGTLWSPSYGEILKDSFSDNSIDPDAWASQQEVKDGEGSPELSFREQNRRLELEASAPPGSLTQSRLSQNALVPLPVAKDWTATVVVCNAVDTDTAPSVRLGLIVSDHSFAHAAGLLLKADDGGRRLQDSESFDVSLRFRQNPSLLAKKGTIRITFFSSIHQLELAYANGEDAPYDKVKTVDTTSWDELSTEGFVLSLQATSAGTPVTSGDAFLDDLLVVEGSEPTLTIRMLDDGTISASYTGSLEETGSLVEPWHETVPQPASPSIFSPSDPRKFFRSRTP